MSPWRAGSTSWRPTEGPRPRPASWRGARLRGRSGRGRFPRCLLERRDHLARLVSILLVRVLMVGDDPAVHVVDRLAHRVLVGDRKPARVERPDRVAIAGPA